MWTLRVAPADQSGANGKVVSWTRPPAQASMRTTSGGSTRRTRRLTIRIPQAVEQSPLNGRGGVAWKLCVEESEVAETWERAIADRLIKPSRHALPHDRFVN